MREFIEIVERHHERTFSDAFKRWFRNSKAVDSSGNPLVLFHGTGQTFDSFKGMVWASVNNELANDYAQMRDDYGQGHANVIPLYMRIENPFNADLGLSKTVTVGEFFYAMTEQAMENGFAINDDVSKKLSALIDQVRYYARMEESGPHYDRFDFWLHSTSMFGAQGAAIIRSIFDVFGFDGVQMIEDGHLTFGVFNPNQVKSIFNAGTYDDDSANIGEDAGASS
jgi:hypothetical protein